MAGGLWVGALRGRLAAGTLAHGVVVPRVVSGGQHFCWASLGLATAAGVMVMETARGKMRQREWRSK